jgi:hypothetical protein
MCRTGSQDSYPGLARSTDCAAQGGMIAKYRVLLAPAPSGLAASLYSVIIKPRSNDNHQVLSFTPQVERCLFSGV